MKLTGTQYDMVRPSKKIRTSLPCLQ